MTRRGRRSGGRSNVVDIGKGRRRRPARTPKSRRPRRGRSIAPFLIVAVAVIIAYFGEQLMEGGGVQLPRVIRHGGESSNASAGPLSGTVTHVRDGDTIEVTRVPVRIANLDCAGLGTAAGSRATERMRELVRGQAVSCRLSGRQSYDREVGTCALADGRDLGRVLIDEGLCGRWR